MFISVQIRLESMGLGCPNGFVNDDKSWKCEKGTCQHSCECPFQLEFRFKFVLSYSYHKFMQPPAVKITYSLNPGCFITNQCVEFEVFTAVVMKSIIFWDIILFTNHWFVTLPYIRKNGPGYQSNGKIKMNLLNISVNIISG
jgi:hypothetical protein